MAAARVAHPDHDPYRSLSQRRRVVDGHHVLRDFDLVVANSGGSVILGGLIKDLPLADIQKYFDDPLLRARSSRRSRLGAARSRASSPHLRRRSALFDGAQARRAAAAAQ